MTPQPNSIAQAREYLLSNRRRVQEGQPLIIKDLEMLEAMAFACDYYVRLVVPPKAPDNLRLLRGIGPASARALRAGGLHTFKALATATGDEIHAIFEREGVVAPASYQTWPEQAAALIATQEDSGDNGEKGA